MATLNGLIRTIRTTSNFWTALLLRSSKNPKVIRFRNGVQIETTYTQYAVLRDWFEELKNKYFNVEVADGGVIIKKSGFNFQTQNILTAKPFFDFLFSLMAQGWTIFSLENRYRLRKGDSEYVIEQIGIDLFQITTDKTTIIGPRETMNVYFYECAAGLYDYNYNNKTVLDIGGFTGETAVYFWSKGAKKVIIYEPFLGHQELIRKNMTLNNVDAELHNEGIGETDGTRIVQYETADIAFGLSNTGDNQTTIRTRNVSNVLLNSKADVAKIDCEGAETSLINVPQIILRLISFYFVETHSHEIEKSVTAKFTESGFEMVREPVRLTDRISMLYFWRSEQK